MSYAGHYTLVDGMDWSSIEPRVAGLLAASLSASDVDPWLQRWSDLASLVAETGSQVYRKVSENTADAEAERHFNAYWEELAPQWRTAEQTLRAKLLATTSYTPTPSAELLIKRLPAGARSACDRQTLGELMALVADQFARLEVYAL